MNILLLGAPGAGKGTQAKMISDEFKLPQISSGDILRKAVADKTKLGKKAEVYMKDGKLVPDEIIIGLIAERLRQKDCKNGFILDGFPRTLAQAQTLESKIRLDHVLNIAVDFNLLVNRITGRRSCPKCNAVYHVENNPPKKENVCDHCGTKLYQREDDTEATVRNRIDVYTSQTEPLIKHYSSKNILKSVDGNKEITEIYKSIKKILVSK